MKAAAPALEDWASTSSCRTRSSCGGHFRVEYQTEEGEALRNDDEFCHVAAWQFNGENQRLESRLCNCGGKGSSSGLGLA